jgi:hypothetical protein
MRWLPAQLIYGPAVVNSYIPPGAGPSLYVFACVHINTNNTALPRSSTSSCVCITTGGLRRTGEYCPHLAHLYLLEGGYGIGG